MLASKVLFEATYSNLSWTIVAQKMFSLEKIKKMEREILAYLGWNVSIQCDELVEFEVRVCQQYGSEPDPDSRTSKTVTNAARNASASISTCSRCCIIPLQAARCPA